jgi:hypothetical protein
MTSFASAIHVVAQCKPMALSAASQCVRPVLFAAMKTARCAHHRSRGPGTVGPQRRDELVMAGFGAELWIWDARRADTWTYVNLPTDSEEIRDLTSGDRRGFGWLRVRVTVGGSFWKTSIFPDSVRSSYVLPIKRAVRTAEALDAGDIATITVELIDF